MDTLKRPPVIRAQLSYYLFVFRIYHQVKRIHETSMKAKRGQAEQAYLEVAKFPHLWLVLKWYQRFTNVLYVYAFLKYIHPDLVPNLVRPLIGANTLFGLPLHCFLLGRFVAYPHLDRIVAILHALANLSWRITLQYANRPYRLDLIDFMSQKDEHLLDYNIQYLEQRRRLSTRQVGEWRQKFQLFHSFMSYEATRDPNLNGRMRIPRSRPTTNVLKMRPNRTMGAKRWLEHRISRMALCGIVCLLGLAVVSLTLIVYEIALDSHYLRVYPNCDPELERLVRERHPNTPFDKLTSSTGTPLRLALSVIDFLESSSIWFESGLGITFVFMLPYILVQDLKYYWRVWNARLNSLLREAQLTSSAIQRSPRQQVFARQHQALGARAFEESLDELRQEICDFFNQFQHYELLMSDIISATFIFWFLGIFGFGYTLVLFYAAGRRILNLPLAHVTYLFLGFFSFPLGLFSGCIFQLQADCGKSYQTLHSLLIYMTPEAKEKYLKILEFFSEQKRHQFSFLLGHRYTPTVVVSIVSWTSSWLALFMSIMK